MTARHDETLDHVFELADVARPRIFGQGVEGIGIQGSRRLSTAVGETTHEVLDQRGNIRLSIPKWRHPEVDDVQPIVEILAEAALGDHVLEVPIGGRYHTDVDDSARLIGPNLLQLAGFQEPQ